MEKFGTYTKSTKSSHTREFKAPEATSYPDSLDWRTKGAVTSIKNQVNLLCMHMPVNTTLCIRNMYTRIFLSFLCMHLLLATMICFTRETVVQVMHSVLLELWKEPSLSLMEKKLLSVNRISLTVQVRIPLVIIIIS